MPLLLSQFLVLQWPIFNYMISSGCKKPQIKLNLNKKLLALFQGPLQELRLKLLYYFIFLCCPTNPIFFTMIAVWKVSKYGIFFDPYFPVFGLNTEIYSVNLRIQSKYRKIRTRKYSVFGHFSRSGPTCN